MTKLLTCVVIALFVFNAQGIAQDGQTSADTTKNAESNVEQNTTKKETDESSGGTFSLGFKIWGGAGIPSYSNVPAGVVAESDVAWAIGAFANWSTTGAIVSLALQPELQYVSESGVKTNFPAGDDNRTTTDVLTTMNSLRLPVLLKLQFFHPVIVQPSIYIGPSFSYVLSATNEAGGMSQDIPDNPFQVGLATGIDVVILNFIVVDLRVNTKFTPLTYDVGEVAQNIELSMASAKFGLGLRF